MTRPPTFEDRLDDWLEDGPTDAPGPVLDTVLAAFPSIPQRRGAWRIPWRSTPMLGFARAVAGLAIVIAVGAAVLLLVTRPTTPAVVGGSGSPSPAAIIATPAPSPTASLAAVVPTATPAPTPTPTPKPTATPIAPCATNHLVIRITLWDGAAGSRTAHLDLKNVSTAPCTVQSIAKPQLVDGHGTALINGTAPTSYSQLTVAPGGTLTTLAQDSNYCGPAPTAPVSVALVLADGRRIIATPFSPTDTTVPPCNGPGQPAAISMHPWAP
jgi:Protein of unknown function (DUF4232)